MLEFRQGCTTGDRVGVYLYTNPINGNSVRFDKDYFTTHPPYSCPLMASLCFKEVVSEAYDLAALLNLRPYQQCGDKHHRYIGKIYQDRDDIYEYVRHLSGGQPALRNVWSLFSGRWDEFSSGWQIPSIAGENPVVHNNLFGLVSSVGNDGLLRQYWNGSTVPLPYTTLSVSSLDPPELSPCVQLDTAPVERLYYFARDDLDQSGRVGSVARSYPVIRYQGGEFGNLTFAYRYGIQYDNQGANRRDINWFTVRLTFDFDPVPVHVDYVGDQVALDSIFNYVCTVEWTPGVFVWSTPIGYPGYHDLASSYEAYHDDPVYFPDLFGDWTERDHLGIVQNAHRTTLATPLDKNRLNTFIGYNPAEDRYDSLGDDTFLRFCSWSDVVVREAVSAVALSYSAAINTQFSMMESNHIEFLFELSDVFAPLDVAKMAYALPDFVGKKGALMVGILDLLADAYLTYSFGIAPTISDAEDVAAKAKNVRERIRSGEAFKAQTSRGKSTIVLEEDNPLGVPPCVVTLRSKVRARPLVDSLLTACFTADTYGLLPQLSTLWDLVPYSFAIDWFTGAGDYLSIVDSQAKILALGCSYVVHTISVRRFFDEGELAQMSVTPAFVGGELSGVGYHKYVRLIDKTAPIFGPTRLPVTSELGIPDFGVAGSLVFKRF